MKKAIIFDTREKVFGHITSKLEQLNYAWEVQRLESGDITFVLDGKDFRNEFVIERKANFSELYGNLTKGHARFKREFNRALEIDTFILLIEEPSYELAKMRFTPNHWKMNKQAFLTSFKTFLEYRSYERTKIGLKPLEVVYCDKYKTAEMIISLINDYLQQKS